MKEVGSRQVVTQSKLIKKIAKETNYLQYEVEDILDGLRTVITKELAEGNVVRLNNLFSLKTMKNEPRAFRPPSTGELTYSEGSIAVRCKPMGYLLDVVNGRKPAEIPYDDEIE